VLTAATDAKPPATAARIPAARKIR